MRRQAGAELGQVHIIVVGLIIVWKNTNLLSNMAVFDKNNCPTFLHLWLFSLFTHFLVLQSISYCIKQLIRIYLKNKGIQTKYKIDVLSKVFRAKVTGTRESRLGIQPSNLPSMLELNLKLKNYFLSLEITDRKWPFVREGFKN